MDFTKDNPYPIAEKCPATPDAMLALVKRAGGVK